PDALGFAASYRDTETGLYYMRARYYDPDLARFISEDPIGLAGGINPYVYAGNNPLTHRDPSGLTQQAPCGVAKPVFERSVAVGASPDSPSIVGPLGSRGVRPWAARCTLNSTLHRPSPPPPTRKAYPGEARRPGEPAVKMKWARTPR
ncbi:MAG: RHS repeat-associated core domain-containing protein, partial [Gemmatimonadota bacterium]